MRVRAGSAPLHLVAALVAVGLTLLFFAPGSLASAAHARRPPGLAKVALAELGFGYSIKSQGPLDASRFPAGSPSASAAAGALSTLGSSVDTYQRSWQDPTGVNQVQDLIVRFSTVASARTFLSAARRALTNGQIVSSKPLPSIPGAQRTTYFASTDAAGVGQTVTLRVGDYAVVLSFFSAASGNPGPITKASAQRVARAQYDALVRAAGGKR